MGNIVKGTKTYRVTGSGTERGWEDIELSMVVDKGDYSPIELEIYLNHFEIGLYSHYKKTKDYGEILLCLSFMRKHSYDIINLLHKESIKLDIVLNGYNSAEATSASL